MRGSSDLIELNGDDLRRDPLNVCKASAVEPRPRRFKLSPGLASVRRRGPDLDRQTIVHKQLKGAYHKGGYHEPFRHSFNRRHYRHGTC